MKHKKTSKHERYKKSKYYGEKRDDMMAWAIILGSIGLFLKIPVLIVLGDLVGMSDHDANECSWYTMAPALIFGWIGLYFNFRAWLADPYKNI